MIKLIKTYLNNRAEAEQDRIDQRRARAAKAKANLIKELKALRLITINNARYIRSSINVLNGAVNHAKGSNAAETKRKREFLRIRLEWLKVKQSEEESMIIHYDSLLKKI
jgi:hypothetical protein